MRTSLFLPRLELNEYSIKIVFFVKTNRITSCSNTPEDAKRVSKISAKLTIKMALL